ncbi:M48 family metalloprotease, partial [Microvirga pakistanensis]|uniref:M48 family metalloprotease n=1 Tax=Microvirga pakistanensis TaxID=1682650 RepID=UPI00141A70BB
VLSHEIAHVTLRHASQRSELQARSELIERVAENVLNESREAAVVQDQARSTLASFSRSQELEADQTGITVLARA